jgi:ketosteroid isomerase-like protein
MRNAQTRIDRRVRLLGLIIASLSWVRTEAANAPAGAASVAAQELHAVESQLSVALSSADVAQLSQLWAGDFTSTMADGHVESREKRLAALRTTDPGAVNRVVNKNERLDVHAYGDWAVVLVTSSWRVDGKRVGDIYQATHVWAKRDGRWRLVAAHISQVKP